jgi:hypothetical protein
MNNYRRGQSKRHSTAPHLFWDDCIRNLLLGLSCIPCLILSINPSYNIVHWVDPVTETHILGILLLSLNQQLYPDRVIAFSTHCLD